MSQLAKASLTVQQLDQMNEELKRDNLRYLLSITSFVNIDLTGPKQISGIYHGRVAKSIGVNEPLNFDSDSSRSHGKRNSLPSPRAYLLLRKATTSYSI
jgi:hypothetical protein